MNRVDSAALTERLNRLQQVAQEKRHRIVIATSAGATHDELGRARAELGIELPEALSRFLTLANGLRIRIFSEESVDDGVATMRLEIFGTRELPRQTSGLHEVGAVEDEAQDAFLRTCLSVANIYGPRHSVIIPTVGQDANRIVSAWYDEPFVAEVLGGSSSLVIADAFDDFVCETLDHAIAGRGGFNYWMSDDFVRDPWSL